MNMIFSTHLIRWYLENKRDLPWRNTQNPYYIWLSEIILQQTKVEQGIDYYHKFITLFPTLKDLALADESQIMKAWQGLGYYSRARNLHFTAQYIYHNLNGVFPNTYKDLLELKGVGAYTAAAIASFAFKEPIAVVDGNVFRVFSRYFGIFEDISLAKNRKIFQELGNNLIDNLNPDLFNQAIMDLGAMVCKPRNPTCTSCPINNSCYAFSKNKIDQLPVNNKSITLKERFLHFVLMQDNDTICIEKRTEKDIWKNLYQFPLIETEHTDLETIPTLITKKWNISAKDVFLYKGEIIHKLTHQKLHIYFWKTNTALPLEYKHISTKEIKNYAFPIVLWKHIVANF